MALTRELHDRIITLRPTDDRKLRFRTSGMAEDVITLLDHVGWTEKRDLHVVGVSLGGMIAMGML